MNHPSIYFQVTVCDKEKDRSRKRSEPEIEV